MITIHEKTAQKFDTLGLGALLPSSCVVTEEINGAYELKMKHPYDEHGKWKRIERGRIITASTPRGVQYFRIYNTKPNMDSIEVNARHVFYDLLDNHCSEISFNGTASGALAALHGAFAFTMPFSFTTDISVSGTLATGRMNPIQALLSDDDETTSFVKGYGGELMRDGFKVSILTAMGQDRDVTIRYGKNLVGLDVTEDEADVKTRIQYHGSDGSGTLDSPFINEYVYPKIHLLEDENKTKAELKAEAQSLFDGGIDIPLVNIKVDFIVLADTVEYADYAPLEEVFLGDIVTIINQKMSFAKKARVISFEWDCLLEKYNEVELGDFMPTLASSVTSGVRSGSLASSAAVTSSAVAAALQAHMQDKNNPHEVTEAQISGSTGDSADTDADTVLELLVEHEENKDNPHEVTALQTGAYTKKEVDDLIRNISVGGSSGIFFGTEAPNDSSGNNGDVYIRTGEIENGIDDKTMILLSDSVVDTSGYNQTIINNGVIASSEKSKFGRNSLYFNGSASLNAQLPLSGDVTIDFWMYFTEYGSSYPTPFQFVSGSVRGIFMHVEKTTTEIGASSISDAHNIVNTGFVISPGTWHHIAFVRNGTMVKFYVDGTLRGTVNNSLTTNDNLILGYISDAQSISGYKGYIEEFRISKTARWNGNFVPPNDAYSRNEFGALYIKQNGKWTKVLKGAA